MTWTDDMIIAILADLRREARTAVRRAAGFKARKKPVPPEVEEQAALARKVLACIPKRLGV
jgi:hypothetical protein